MNTQRDPQLALRLDGKLPDAAERWHDGASIAYLGGSLRLALNTVGKEARREDDVLHLPLPPQATPRQIQDRAEAWLRHAAKRELEDIVSQKSALAGRRPPKLALSFSARGHWADIIDANALRCNWRLIEQPRPIIEQVVARAIAALPHEDREADLFGALPA
jgi:predicted metal-dependent hydrolase